jgi:hypothetical protein
MPTFQLFMGLLDADRFEGRFREGVHKADVSDMMKRWWNAKTFARRPRMTRPRPSSQRSPNRADDWGSSCPIWASRKTRCGRSLQLSEAPKEFFKNAYRNVTIPRRGRRGAGSRRSAGPIKSENDGRNTFRIHAAELVKRPPSRSGFRCLYDEDGRAADLRSSPVQLPLMVDFVAELG